MRSPVLKVLIMKMRVFINKYVAMEKTVNDTVLQYRALQEN